MVALVSLVCPSCGGTLKVAPNVNSITCQYCGTEHAIKHEMNGALALEAYARCPVCGRNDKAEKVSAVIASQTHEISGTEQKTEEVTNAQGQKQVVVRDVPFTRRQVSVLGQRLAAPAPFDQSKFPPFPQAPKPAAKNKGISAIVLGSLSLIASLCGAGLAISMLFQPETSYTRQEVNSIYVTFGAGAGAAVLFFLLGGGLLAGGILLIVRGRKQAPLAMAQYQSQVDAVQQERTRMVKVYEQTVSRWNRLYYCSRDDCVFIPGENSSAPVSGMHEYLTQAPPSSGNG